MHLREIHFLSERWSFKLELAVNSYEKLFEIYNQLVTIFCDYNPEANKYSIAPCLFNNVILKKINDYSLKYETYCAAVNKLPARFRELKEEEYFYVVPAQDFPDKFRIYLRSILKAKNLGIHEPEELNRFIIQEEEIYQNLYGDLLEQYSVGYFPKGKYEKVGVPDRSKRICRFCGRSGKVNFQKKAHAIPEALGNKKLIALEECDICNENFGNGIEKDLINYLTLQRLALGIKGKQGTITIKCKNSQNIERKDDKLLLSENLHMAGNDNHSPRTLKFEPYDKITDQNLYKALVKIVLSVIDKSQLCNFQKTIKWVISNQLESENLPVIATLFDLSLFDEQPKLVIYTRKITDFKLPSVVAEFYCAATAFIFLLPFGNLDQIDFTDPVNYDYFFSQFKYYSKIGKFSFEHFSNTSKRDIIYSINLN